jgi:CRP-like cAMP-binding protein
MKEEIIKILKNVGFLKELANKEEELKKIAEIINYKKMKKGTIIIKEGEIGDNFYILKSGKVSILKKTLDNEEYSVATLESKGDNIVFFGELALLDNDKRSATVVADSDVELLAISRDDFIKLGNKYPYIGLIITREISKILASRLRKANEDIVTLTAALIERVSAE